MNKAFRMFLISIIKNLLPMLKHLRVIAIMNDNRFHEVECRVIILVIIPVNQCINPLMSVVKRLKTSRIAVMIFQGLELRF